MIKEKRKSLHLTQVQMAEKLGISVRQYVRIDHEEGFPRREVLQKLITTLELSDEEVGQYIRDICKS